MTYQEAIEMLGSRSSKKLANNTYLTKADGGSLGRVAVKLHSTNVVELFSDSTYVLNSGGWRTATTKDRINGYSPARISQVKNVWYLRDGSLFYDGMTIDAYGNPLEPKEPSDYESKLKAIKKEAKAYAHAFVEELKAGNIPMPSGGDCWFCALRTSSEESLGEATNNPEHIKSHIEEKYYVPSLLVNAGRAAGYQDFQIGMMGIGGQRLFIDPERHIYKYVVKQLQKEL